jgi:hypothetical protein
MSDSISVGDTVIVSAPNFGGPWHGEVLRFIEEQHWIGAEVRCLRTTKDASGKVGIRAGVDAVLSVEFLTVAGDPEWPWREHDGCDDVGVSGRVRPYHRHAATGRAHAHPGGDQPHTHQDPAEVIAMSVAAVAGGVVGKPAPADFTIELPDAFKCMVSDVVDSHQPGAEVRDAVGRVAHLLVRQAMALAYEGVGPMGDEDTDPATIAAAVAAVRAVFDDHELWDHGLLPDDQHPEAGCERCERRSESGFSRTPTCR